MATIAFLGLGNMGGPMAKNLLAAGHQLTVFDLVEAACAALAAEGASVAASAAEAAENADVIISMLPAGKHVAGIFLGDDGLLAMVERVAAPLSNVLGWHSDFEIETVLQEDDLAVEEKRPLPPMGMMTFLVLRKSA